MFGDVVSMQENFEGKAVIVTGSSKGIGETTAVLFAKRGANVTICGHEPEKVEAVLSSCREASPDGKNKCISVCGDMTDNSVQTETVDRTVEAFGRLDVLVVNHGIIIPVISATDVTPQAFDAMMNINVKTTFFLIQKAIPHLEKTQGKIIASSSIASTVVFPPTMAYAMTKAALDHLTRLLALELGPKGIRVNNVNPGMTDTSMPVPLMGKEGLTKASKHQPLHGSLAGTDDVAKVILFLAGDGASFITGECIKVDGGFNLVTLAPQ